MATPATEPAQRPDTGTPQPDRPVLDAETRDITARWRTITTALADAAHPRHGLR